MKYLEVAAERRGSGAERCFSACVRVCAREHLRPPEEDIYIIIIS